MVHPTSTQTTPSVHPTAVSPLTGSADTTNDRSSARPERAQVKSIATAAVA